MKPVRIAAAALAVQVLALGAAGAEPFKLMIYETPAQLALREVKTPEGAAYWNSWGSAAKAMADAGIVRGGSALAAGPVVGRTGSGAMTVSASPMDAALSLGGYFQIDVADGAAALDWAAKLPVGQGMVEVRAGYPAPGM